MQNIYPNPAKDRLTVEVSSDIDQIIVRNTFGQVIQQVNQPSVKTEINLNNLPVGLYNISFNRGDSFWATKFLKQ